MFVEGATGRVGHRSQILTDDLGAVSGRDDAHGCPLLIGGVPHVGAIGRGGAFRNEPQAVETHHVVEAQHASEPQVRVEARSEVRMTGAARRVRRERREPPVLPVREERVRRGSDGRVLHEQIGILRDVEAGAVRTDREVEVERLIARVETLREILELPVAVPLHELVIPHGRFVRPFELAAEARVLRHFRPVGEPAEPVGVVFGCARDRLERRSQPSRTGGQVDECAGRGLVDRGREQRGSVEIHLVPEPARDRRVRARIAGFVAVAEERREQRQACRRSCAPYGATQSASRRSVPRSPVVEWASWRA